MRRFLIGLTVLAGCNSTVNRTEPITFPTGRVELPHTRGKPVVISEEYRHFAESAKK